MLEIFQCISEVHKCTWESEKCTRENVKCISEYCMGKYIKEKCAWERWRGKYFFATKAPRYGYFLTGQAKTLKETLKYTKTFCEILCLSVLVAYKLFTFYLFQKNINLH